MYANTPAAHARSGARPVAAPSPVLDVSTTVAAVPSGKPIPKQRTVIKVTLRLAPLAERLTIIVPTS